MNNAQLEKRVKELEEAGGDMLIIVMKYRELLTDIVQKQFNPGFTLANLNSLIAKARDFLIH